MNMENHKLLKTIIETELQDRQFENEHNTWLILISFIAGIVVGALLTLVFML